MRNLFILFFIPLLLMPLSLYAESENGEDTASSAGNDYAYYGLEPDIITNYVNEDKKHLGYIRVSVELMIKKSTDMAKVKHHAPLIRDAIIRILGEQNIKRIRSIKGREDIRTYCLEVANNLMVQEEGVKIFKDLLFTKYLYQ